MSILSKFLGLDAQAPASDTTPQGKQLNSFLASLNNPNWGQDQLNSMTTAAVNNALPSYLTNLQGTKESNIARGISTGDLGTSFENDLTSAFQRNVASSVASQAGSLFGQRNSLLYGGLNDELDRAQAAQDNAAQRKSSLFGGLFQLGGLAMGGGHV